MPSVTETGLDIDALRADTPGCADTIHLNNAGAALPPRAVTQAQIDHLLLESSIGGYEAAAKAAPALDNTYAAIAKLLNCRTDEIAVVENATRAWDMAFYAFDFRPGDRIVTGKAEYASNVIAFLQMARKTGAVIEVVPDDAFGQIDINALAESLNDTSKGQARLVALSHVPTNGGLVNPAAAVGRIAGAAGVPFLLDACQSAGQMPLDVATLGCTMLSATGRKFLRGPRGIGFLYVRRDWIDRLEPPFLDLHAAEWTGQHSYAVRPDARRFETFETSPTAKIGLGVAVDYALSLGLDKIRKRIGGLASHLRGRLNERDETVVLDKGLAKSGIVTFVKIGEHPEATTRRLSAAGINVSITTRNSTLYDMAERDLDEMVRASPHVYNTQDELDRLVDAVLAG